MYYNSVKTGHPNYCFFFKKIAIYLLLEFFSKKYVQIVMFWFRKKCSNSEIK
jgi:hypothetical protein